MSIENARSRPAESSCQRARAMFAKLISKYTQLEASSCPRKEREGPRPRDARAVRARSSSRAGQGRLSQAASATAGEQQWPAAETTRRKAQCNEREPRSARTSFFVYTQQLITMANRSSIPRRSPTFHASIGRERSSLIFVCF